MRDTSVDEHPKRDKPRRGACVLCRGRNMLFVDETVERVPLIVDGALLWPRLCAACAECLRACERLAYDRAHRAGDNKLPPEPAKRVGLCPAKPRATRTVRH